VVFNWDKEDGKPIRVDMVQLTIEVGSKKLTLDVLRKGANNR